MIRKLQIKFVAMCMILVTAVLGVVFTAVFFSAKQNIEVISHQVLQRVMEDDTPSGRIWGSTGAGKTFCCPISR